MHEDDEEQGDRQFWWVEEHEGKSTGVQIGWDTVRSLQEEV